VELGFSIFELLTYVVGISGLMSGHSYFCVGPGCPTCCGGSPRPGKVASGLWRVWAGPKLIACLRAGRRAAGQMSIYSLTTPEGRRGTRVRVELGVLVDSELQHDPNDNTSHPINIKARRIVAD
jgi:hypothetical protein